MYADFFDPPSKPFVKGKPSKGKGKAVEAPPPKTKGSKGKLAKTVEPTAGAKTVTKKRSVRFSESVKVKEIAPRGSEFDKLVAKFGYEKAEVMMAETEKSGSSSREDEEVFGAEGEEDLVMGDYDPERDGEGDDGDSDEEEDDEEEEEEGEEDDEEEYESEDDEGQETIARLKSSLFDEEEPDDDSSTPGALSTLVILYNTDYPLPQPHHCLATNDDYSPSHRRSHSSRLRTSEPRTGQPRERPRPRTDLSTVCWRRTSSTRGQAKSFPSWARRRPRRSRSSSRNVSSMWVTQSYLTSDMD